MRLEFIFAPFSDFDFQASAWEENKMVRSMKRKSKEIVRASSGDISDELH